MNVTIEEARKRRHEAEREIAQIVHALEHDTGMQVRGVRLSVSRVQLIAEPRSAVMAVDATIEWDMP